MFADRPASIRQIIKKLTDLDLSKGKSYEKVEKLAREIQHATYLLVNLKAEKRLAEDMNLVGLLLRKLPLEYRREWTRWVSRNCPDATPGENEWPEFLKWMDEQKLIAKKDRWYEEADDASLKAHATPQVKVECRKCKSTSHRT